MKRKNVFLLFIPIVIAMVVIDRLSKAWAVDTLHQGVKGFDFGPIALTMVHNFGAAFGMGKGNGIVFLCIAAVIIIAAVLWLALAKGHPPIEVISLALISAGGIGNAIDRLTTEYVVDFIQFTFIDFPVFNVADICVTCGVVIFVVYSLFFSPWMKSDSAKDEQ